MTFAVGDLASLPNPFEPGDAVYQSAAMIYAAPGRIVSIADGWAVVNLGRWGQFGRAVEAGRGTGLGRRCGSVPCPGPPAPGGVALPAGGIACRPCRRD